MGPKVQGQSAPNAGNTAPEQRQQHHAYQGIGGTGAHQNVGGGDVLRLAPLQYTHITNENTNTVHLVVGPLNRPLESNETKACPTSPFIVVPPTHYCLVRNPVVMATDVQTGQRVPVVDAYDEAKVRVGEVEVRYHVPAFPLYPEETVVALEPLRVLSPSEALLLDVKADFTHPVTGVFHPAGERYVLQGPCTYYPHSAEALIETRATHVTTDHSGLHCEAIARYEDTITYPATLNGTAQHVTVVRQPQESYLRFPPASYFALPWEKVERVVEPIVLTASKGVHVKVTRDYTDPRSFAPNVQRRTGEVFFVCGADTPYFVPHPYDTVLDACERVYVSPDHYCVVCDPVILDATRRTIVGQQFGTREVRTATAFFHHPGEVMEVAQPHPVCLLSAQQAVLVVALDDFEDSDGAGEPSEGTSSANTAVSRKQGDRWLVRGPRRWIPNAHVRVVADPATGEEVRNTILLGEGEGLYVRDTVTGVVRCVVGPTCYLLNAHEALWTKSLSATAQQCLERQVISHASYMITNSDQLLNSSTTHHLSHEGSVRESDLGCAGTVRGSGSVAQAVVYHIPHRSVTQLYNYTTQKTRIVFGPNRILLEPDEAFTVVSLSGSPWDAKEPTRCMPKQPDYITSLYLYLGPSNMSDVVRVETRDHAQLELQLCYDWFFDIAEGDEEAAKHCFNVNDFVGDTCFFIASRIRAAVAALPFEEFHKNSGRILRAAVFGVDPVTQTPDQVLRFASNNLVVTSVDTQAMEVLDVRTRQGLQKAAKMAIEITTRAQEIDAQQIASTREQEARAGLDRQRMRDQVANEEEREKLASVQSQALAIVNSGKAKALAAAQSRSAAVDMESALQEAKLRAERELFLHSVTSEVQHKRKALLADHEANMSRVAFEYETAMQAVRNDLIKQVTAAVGPQTILEMAKAGPELQAKLLQSLGLQGYLVTDGSSPINLFRTAEQMTSEQRGVMKTIEEL